jgi:hypothetical protein
MKLAARLSGQVTKLVLLETNPFYLLEQCGRADAFAEAMDLRNCVKKFRALGESQPSLQPRLLRRHSAYADSPYRKRGNRWQIASNVSA